MPFGRIAEPRKRPHHRRTHFAAAAEPAASRPHALNGASLLFRNGATRNERMERTSRGPACGEPCLAPGGMPRAARRRRYGRAMRFWPAVTTRAATRLAAALRRCMHARTRRPGLDCNVRQRKKPARRGPVPRIATTRCTTFEARLVGAETAVSKHRSGRLGNRKWRTGKFDALPNSGQSPRRAKNRRAIKRTTWPITDQIRIQRSMPLRDLGQIRKQWRCPARVSSEPAIAPAHRGAARDPSAAAFAASVEIARAGMASGRRTPFWRKQRYFIHAGPSAARFDCRPNEKAVSEMSSTRIRRPCALALSASRLADQNRQMALSRLIGAPPLFRYRGRTRPRCPHRMRNGTPKAPRRYAPCSAKGERFRESR
ncbi:hypothetical protein BUH_7287 [Burkholderia pseudomallei Pakistan 9]|nr:hypothetical protein BURPSPAST_AC0051 [Burkholderia pseudomallei Pasteur 52237]EEH30021.1 hypothetical protein BUH_7287 [Burkholderia pseudomallei Pakistan 9]